MFIYTFLMIVLFFVSNVCDYVIIHLRHKNYEGTTHKLTAPPFYLNTVLTFYIWG